MDHLSELGLMRMNIIGNGVLIIASSVVSKVADLGIRRNRLPY